jgi:hypothetical protein
MLAGRVATEFRRTDSIDDLSGGYTSFDTAPMDGMLTIRYNN